MGAEIGISTDKLHARGPMGLNELTSYKYIIHGTGQIRRWNLLNEILSWVKNPRLPDGQASSGI